MTGWPALTNSAPSALPSRPAPIVAILTGWPAGPVWADAIRGLDANEATPAALAAKRRAARRVGRGGRAVGMVGSSGREATIIAPAQPAQSSRLRARGAYM